jgi:hypothetical protein
MAVAGMGHGYFYTKAWAWTRTDKHWREGIMLNAVMSHESIRTVH